DVMGIIITNPDSYYEGFSIELSVSYAPNLRDVGLNSRPKPRRKGGVDASRSNMELDAVAPGLAMGLGVDTSMPTVELGVGVPQPNLGLDTQKDIAPFWVMTFAHYLLNEVELRNHDPSIALQVFSFFGGEMGRLKAKEILD
ncbi:hypothetical protein H0E87_012762, partial [Populus deltoides]